MEAVTQDALGVLFITSPEPDTLEDTLHEGLDSLLGPENVICYPYKDYSRFGYNFTPPSAVCRPHRFPVGRVRLAGQREAIRAVVVGSVHPEALASWARLQDLFPEVPVALVFGRWSAQDPWPTGIRYTHLFCQDLQPEHQSAAIHPITHAVPPRVMAPAEVDRDIPVSFVGRTTHPDRVRFIQVLERAGYLVLMDADISREQFCAILNRTRIGVSLRGTTYDTFRYWEVPYHGALLLSQRLPIVVPDDFVEGETAVYFSDPGEMLERIRELLSDEERLRTIALAGRNFVRSKHTAAARARYVLHTLGVDGVL